MSLNNDPRSHVNVFFGVPGQYQIDLNVNVNSPPIQGFGNGYGYQMLQPSLPQAAPNPFNQLQQQRQQLTTSEWHEQEYHYTFSGQARPCQRHNDLWCAHRDCTKSNTDSSGTSAYPSTSSSSSFLSSISNVSTLNPSVSNYISTPGSQYLSSFGYNSSMDGGGSPFAPLPRSSYNAGTDSGFGGSGFGNGNGGAGGSSFTPSDTSTPSITHRESRFFARDDFTTFCNMI